MDQTEVKPEEKINPEQNSNSQIQVNTLENEPTHSSDVQKENWRKFREQKELERKQRIEAERVAAEERAKAEALKSAMEALLNKPNQGNEYQNQYSQEITEEERIEKKVQEALSKRETEYERQRIERERQEFPTKLNQTYSDFNQVCSSENLDYLEYHYPELAAPFKHMPDGYDKWSSIYKAVKRLVPNPDSKKDSQKADKNFQKPQSLSSSSMSQGSHSIPPKMLDEQRKSDNWKRMQKAIRDLT